MAEGEAREAPDNIELFKARYAYGWSWFDFHAKQRTTVFNYLLIVDGLLASAFGANFKPGSYFIASMVALTGMTASFGFLALEARNRQLVQWGENILRQSELEFLFADLISDDAAKAGPVAGCPPPPHGILARERYFLDPPNIDERSAQRGGNDKPARREEIYFGFDGTYTVKNKNWVGLHKMFGFKWTSYIGHAYWFPRIIMGFAVLFAALCVSAALFSAGLLPLSAPRTKTLFMYAGLDGPVIAGAVRPQLG